jgi:hypothetical protein
MKQCNFNAKDLRPSSISVKLLLVIARSMHFRDYPAILKRTLRAAPAIRHVRCLVEWDARYTKISGRCWESIQECVAPPMSVLRPLIVIDVAGYLRTLDVGVGVEGLVERRSVHLIEMRSWKRAFL